MSAFDNVEFIKASAGSGKTFSLMGRVEKLVVDEKMPVTAILATTFTVKAANELKSRIRRELLGKDRIEEAQQVEDALIGTVDSICGRLLSDYAIDAGENPSMSVLPEENAEDFLKRALHETISNRMGAMAPLAARLGFDDDSWMGVVRSIIDSARSNAMDKEKLAAAKDYSIEVAKKIYDGTDETLKLEGIKVELQPILEGAKDVSDALAKDEAKAKKDFGAGLCGFCALVMDYDSESWKKALALSNKNNKPSARNNQSELLEKSLAVHESIGKRLLHSKALQQDVCNFITEIFSIAQEGLNKFQAYKSEFGLVDFVDQETKILCLLNSARGEALRKALRDRIKIVMVDEFQDTNPLQLAVFLKLHEIVGRSIWVGDPKQSIYSFRGADPSFMAEIMKGLEDANKEKVNSGKESLIHVLPYSWRSRENLVAFSNEVFALAFADTPPEDVKLDIHPEELNKEKRKGGRISVWQKKAEYRYGIEAVLSDLASRVKSLFDGEHPRIGQYKDLAILLRSNNECFKLSLALQREGLPVSVGGGQLKDDPIAYLGMCAYRRAYSLKDTVAEEILRRYVSDVDFDANADVEQNLTPLELLEMALVSYGVDDYVRRSSNVEHGMATLEALRDLCREYMSDCALRGTAARQEGFIRYFNEAKKEGAAAVGGDCIQVMTYHKAKGLEWPVVVLSSLDYEPNSSPFGVRVIQDGAFDATQPLENRTLQYVPAPFGAKRKDEISPFKDKGIDEFDKQLREVQAREKEEAKRLMYVGVTRAKDEVIFFAKRETLRTNPDGVSKIAWLEALSDQSIFADNFNMKDGAVKWKIGPDAREFDVDMELLTERKGDCEMPPQAGWSDSIGKEEKPLHPAFRVSPSSLEGMETGATVGEKIEMSSGMGVTLFSRPSDLGDCVHAYMAAAVPARDENRQLAEGVIARWCLDDVVDADKLVQAGIQLRKFIDERWPGAVVHAEVPMSIVFPTGQVSEGFIDMLVETEAGYVIIDHKMLCSLRRQLGRKCFKRFSICPIKASAWN